MKKIIVGLVFVIGAAFSANAQIQSKKDDSNSKIEIVQLKDHVCTSACKAEACIFVYGEKGHTCSAECAKMEASQSEKINNTEHVCTANCKDSLHMCAHGKKGHTCTEACKKKM